jgi:DnaK suppressor protein
MPLPSVRMPAPPGGGSASGELAPWLAPATGAAAALAGAWLTLVVAQRFATRLQFNVRARSRAARPRCAAARLTRKPCMQAVAGGAAAAAAAVLAALVAAQHSAAGAQLLALPLHDGLLQTVSPTTVRAAQECASRIACIRLTLPRCAPAQLPALALCACVAAIFGTLALLVLTAPRGAARRASAGAAAPAARPRPAQRPAPAPEPASTPLAPFSFASAAYDTTLPTPVAFSPRGAAVAAPRAAPAAPVPARSPSPPGRSPAAQRGSAAAKRAGRAPAAEEAPPPSASPVASPSRGRSKGATIACLRAAARVRAPAAAELSSSHARRRDGARSEPQSARGQAQGGGSNGGGGRCNA